MPSFAGNPCPLRIVRLGSLKKSAILVRRPDLRSKVAVLSQKPVSRFPVPDIAEMPEDIRAELHARLGALQSFVTYANAGTPNPIEYLRSVKRVV